MRGADIDYGDQLVAVIRKGTRALQWLPASPDSFVWLRLYQHSLPSELLAADQPVWWTLRRPWRALDYDAMRAVLRRVNAMLGTNWTLHDLRHIFVTDAIRSGLPPHIAAKICGHSTVDTTMGYAAIYPEDVIAHHRAFIARRRAERPSEEYRDLTAQEWDEFLAHFELRKVALGTCGRDHGTPCAHENACVRCPLLRVDPAQIQRLQGIHANLVDRLREAKDQGWLGEVAAIETTMAGAAQKLEAMRAARNATVHLGMPEARTAIGRASWADR